MALPSGRECAQYFTGVGWEPRPMNHQANTSTPGPVTLPDWSEDWDPIVNEKLVPRIDGDFTGTTDQIIAWGACKWGIEPDLVRAMAVKESDWKQAAAGDYEDEEDLCVGRYEPPCPTSFGLLQIKHFYRPGSYPDSARYTAFNVDYALAVIRGCYEGWVTYLPSDYGPGDLWGCIGFHYSGQWKDRLGLDYVRQVQQILAKRTWTRY